MAKHGLTTKNWTSNWLKNTWKFVLNDLKLVLNHLKCVK